MFFHHFYLMKPEVPPASEQLVLPAKISHEVPRHIRAATNEVVRAMEEELRSLKPEGKAA